MLLKKKHRTSGSRPTLKMSQRSTAKREKEELVLLYALIWCSAELFAMQMTQWDFMEQWGPTIKRFSTPKDQSFFLLQGVTIPSQIRYIRYFADSLYSGLQYSKRLLFCQKVTLFPRPKVDGPIDIKIFVWKTLVFQNSSVSTLNIFHLHWIRKKSQRRKIFLLRFLAFRFKETSRLSLQLERIISLIYGSTQPLQRSKDVMLSSANKAWTMDIKIRRELHQILELRLSRHIYYSS